MSHEIKDSKSSKIQKWSGLVFCYSISLIVLFLGFGWLEEINTQGYYIDSKHHIAIAGKEGLVTVYGLIIGGFSMLVFSIYATVKNFMKKF